MRRFGLVCICLLAATSAVAADTSAFGPLRAQDERLLRIAEPIMARNVQLCDRTMPDLGVSLQSTDQYPPSAQPGFAAPVAFAAVLPDSAAEKAGIRRNDGLVSIDGKPIARRADLTRSPLRDSVFAALAEHDAAKPLELGIVHDGQAREVTVQLAPECRAMVEILDVSSETARSDGQTIQMAYGLVTRATDDQIAAIFAHELAHAILHHRERLSAANASKGLLGEFGRNQRLNRQAEEEADRLSVYLLANAGIDPHAAPNLWRSKLGRHISGGIFHDAAHPSAKTRAEIMEAEIAQHIRPGQASYPAALMATRTRPMN